jgi:hypothetical protein
MSFNAFPMSPAHEGRWRELQELARAGGFPAFSGTFVAKHLRTHVDEARVLLDEASDEAFAAAIESLRERYPNMRAAEKVVGFLVSRCEAFGRSEVVVVPDLGGTTLCACDEGWLYTERRIPGYSFAVDYAAHCQHCNSAEIRLKRSAKAKDRVGRDDWVGDWDEVPEEAAARLRDLVRESLSSQDPDTRRGAARMAALLRVPL